MPKDQLTVTFNEPALSDGRTDQELHEFFRRRLGKFSFFLGAALLVFMILVTVVALVTGDLQVPMIAIALTIPAIYGTVWLAAGQPLPIAILKILDGGSAVFATAALLLIAYTKGDFQIAFAPTCNLLTLRAVFVPSRARETLLVDVLAFAPVIVMAILLRRQFLAGADVSVPPSYVVFAASTALWLAIPVVVSRVIYGLRQEIRDAKKLGQYTLLEKIGAGGMGEVYKARHALLSRLTAVKLIHPDRADEQHRVRFEREVEATSKLTHPNTVSIYDYGHTSEQVFYYVMEFLPGISLAELVQDDGPQPPARVIHLLRQVCGSLHEAHAVGIIHRDIKPENLILCERGRVYDVVKVVDFGIAKDLSAKAVSVTQENAVVGTPHYLSPEAFTSNNEVGTASDIYSVGVVGYYLLTAKRPFTGKNVIEIAMSQMNSSPVRLTEARGEPVADDLETAVFSCLARDATARPTARELDIALQKCGAAGDWSQADAESWWSRRSRASQS